LKPEPEKFRDLARFLLKTRPEEMTCDEWLDHVGEYAEALLAGGPVPPTLAEVERHMDICPECTEEFRALLAALRDEC
jgi:hypothetical protein